MQREFLKVVGGVKVDNIQVIQLLVPPDWDAYFCQYSF